MAELTLEQQRAIAKARARQRITQGSDQPVSTGMDIARSGMTGLRQGVEGLASMMGDANQTTGNVAAWLAGKAGLGEGGQEMIRTAARYVSPFPGAPTSQEVQGVTTDLVGEHYQPQTTAGDYTRTIAEFAPAAAAGPGNLTRRAITQALIPALGSETAGQLTEDTALEPYARIAGALVAPLATHGVERGVRRLTGPSGAERMFSRAAGADAVDDIGARLSAMGDDAMPMDLGPNLQRQAGAIASQPGRGQEIVRSAVANRQGNAGRRVTGYLNDALGGADDMTALADDVARQRAEVAKPLYQRAYAEGADGILTPEIERMTGSPAFGEAMRKAATSGQDRAVLEGYGAFNPRVTVTQDNRILFNQTKPGGSPLYPDLQYWDYVKRNLDDMAGEATRAGRNEQASVARNLASRLRGELDNAVPSYKAARDAYAGHSAIMDAMEEGQKVFANSVTPGQLKAQLANMSEGERQAFIQGARAQIANTMGTARNDALAARSTFQKGYNQEKLALLLGKEQADDLIRSLESETAFTRTRDVVTGNSETAARQAAQRELSGSDAPGMFRSAGNMRFGDAAATIADKLLGRFGAVNRDRRMSEVADLLTSRDRNRIAELLTRTQQSNQSLTSPKSGIIAALLAAQNNRQAIAPPVQ